MYNIVNHSYLISPFYNMLTQLLMCWVFYFLCLKEKQHINNIKSYKYVAVDCATHLGYEIFFGAFFKSNLFIRHSLVVFLIAFAQLLSLVFNKCFYFYYFIFVLESGSVTLKKKTKQSVWYGCYFRQSAYFYHEQTRTNKNKQEQTQQINKHRRNPIKICSRVE